MDKKVFISGPIQGTEKRQHYRAQIQKLLTNYGYKPIDPWRREKVLYRGPPKEWWNNVPPKDFIQRDLEDIEKCDILIAYLPKLSAGTCMEIFYAKMKSKKVVIILELANASPWITAHSDVLIKGLTELESLLKKGI